MSASTGGQVRTARETGSDSGAGLLLMIALFLSGAAALVYQVLWLKELGRLFGVTAHAAAATLGIFFLGLAAGGFAWGRRAARIASPLRAYALLEVGIAASAIVYFALLPLYGRVLGPMFEAIGQQPNLMLAFKVLLAAGLLFLPSFLMGGTLPVLAQALVRHAAEFGARASRLYAINTLGAATGALAAGFVLPRYLGFTASYLVAIGINLGVAAIAWHLAGQSPAGAARAELPDEPDQFGERELRQLEETPAGLIATLAAASGLGALCLEVLWTRMFAQVLQNSVYTFSIILTVFLACLALGSTLAAALCRRSFPPRSVLAWLLGLAGVLVALTPIFYTGLAHSLDYTASRLGFVGYAAVVFGGIALIVGPAVLAMGSVFPYLMKLSERQVRSAGRTLGMLAAINTTAAIVGSVLGGFVLLRALGVTRSVLLVAALYFAASLVALPRKRRRSLAALAPIAGLVAVSVFALVSAPKDALLKRSADETIVEAREGASGTVAVVRFGEENLRIRVNSSYNIGSSASAPTERLQSQLALAMHPDPRSVFFIGMGTGITASGAMDLPLERIAISELNPDIVRASRKHFAPWLKGLFEDPRVEIIPEDGRTWLAYTDERFDVVIADIFLSFKAGVGSLYTLEHFRSVRESLEPGGVFVQWLPMFDLSHEEFDIIARTLTEVFPNVTLWRRSMSPRYPVYALVARVDESPVDPNLVRGGLARFVRAGAMDPRLWVVNIPFAAYVSDVAARRGELADVPLNTDDRTILEYVAPITQRESHGALRSQVLAWRPLLEFCEKLQMDLPPDEDPSLARLARAERRQVIAGTAFYGAEVYRRLGDASRRDEYMRRYQSALAP